MESAQAFIGIL